MPQLQSGQASGPKTAEDGKLAWRQAAGTSPLSASLNKGLPAAASGLFRHQADEKRSPRTVHLLHDGRPDTAMWTRLLLIDSASHRVCSKLASVYISVSWPVCLKLKPLKASSFEAEEVAMSPFLPKSYDARCLGAYLVEAAG